MNNYKKTIPLALIFTFFSFLNSSEAQLINKFENLQGFTKTDDITILDDFSEVSGLVKIGEAYSKARGVTLFSAMNNLNSRAKRKLLEEATVRGASHVLITKRLPDDGIGLTSLFLGRLFSYQAIFYKEDSNIISENQVRSVIQNNRFTATQTMTTNRNTFGAKHANFGSGSILRVDSNTELTSKNGKVFIIAKTPKPTGIIISDTYEVIGFNSDYILLTKEIKDEKMFRAYLLKKN
ncbi:hypothetical protein [Mongoliibacter ruber]|uniref:Uncharacterized protein n=1 Tax=Mongoliibacter ruber TaxID=1750599 RepID=A0A2T0WIV2_9BACT|nr:hypothetical protein [Mongoliibacter ruber]PRY86641.1 hypothetical protein CLW00_108128 [Mongoliibacter ruber]